MSGFKHGIRPVLYLGVPLVSVRLTDRECKPLIGQIKNKIWMGDKEALICLLTSVGETCNAFILP